jgi:hypothetical protein
MSVRNDPHATLMAAMGAKTWDPIPTPQHQWQSTEGEPTKYRIWSCLCEHTIQARFVKNEPVRTGHATLADGVTPMTLAYLSKLLGTDKAVISRSWKEGEEEGLWRRDPKTGWLRLNGGVTKAQVLRAKKRRVDCTVNHPREELLQIQALPVPEQAATMARLKASRDYWQAKIASDVAANREAWAATDDNILRAVRIEKRRSGRRSPPPPELPQLLLDFVQSTTENAPEVDRTHGEDVGKKSTVRGGASLLPSEKYLQREPSASSKGTSSAASPPANRDDAAPLSIEETARKAAGFQRLTADDQRFCREELAETPPEIVRAGIILGRARQLVHATNRGALPRISSLRYFAGSIQEAAGGFDAGYIEYLEHKLKRHGETDTRARSAGGGS